MHFEIKTSGNVLMLIYYFQFLNNNVDDMETLISFSRKYH